MLTQCAGVVPVNVMWLVSRLNTAWSSAARMSRLVDCQDPSSGSVVVGPAGGVGRKIDHAPQSVNGLTQLLHVGASYTGSPYDVLREQR